MKKTNKKGFTLVELLVVIAILAILATVSVVGYTAFIERATVSNDENVAAQLNQFLTAMKADSTGDYYNKTINEQNVADFIQQILSETGLTDSENNPKLEPSSKYHYYFDITDQKFVLLQDSETGVKSSGIKIINSYINAAGEDLKPGFFNYTVNGEQHILFFADTSGSTLATVIRGFYSFNGIEGADSKEQLVNFIANILNLNSDYPHLYNSYYNFAQKAVFVTANGNFAISTGAHSELFVIAGARYIDSVVNVIDVSSGSLSQVQVSSANPFLTTDSEVLVPGNIYVISNSLIISSETEGKNPTIVINASSWDDVKKYFDAGFTASDVTVKLIGSDTEYTVVENLVYESEDYTANGTNATVVATLCYNNPVYDFDIEISHDDATNYHEASGDELDNVGYIDYAKVRENGIQLSIANEVGKLGAGYSVSYPYYTWEITKIVNVDDSEVASAYFGKYFSIDENGLLTFKSNEYVAFKYIQIKATAKLDKTGDVNGSGERAAQTFELHIGGISFGTVKLATADNSWDNTTEPDGNGNYTISVTHNAGGTTYSITNSSAENNKLTNSFDGSMTISYADEDSKDIISFDSSNGSITTKAGGTATITVKVGVYYSYTLRVNVIDESNLPVQMKNSGIYYVGSLDAIKLSDIFTGTIPTSGTTRVMAVSGSFGGTALEPDFTGTSFVPVNDTTKNLYIDEASYQINNNKKALSGKTVTSLNDTLKFVGQKIINDKISIALFNENGARISSVVSVYVAEAKNVRSGSDLTYGGTYSKSDGTVTTNNVNGSVVLLGDIEITKSNSFVLFYNSTVYGNHFTFDITKGKSNGHGVIKLRDSNMQDLQVVGKLYTTVAIANGSPNSSNAVEARGTCTINNCYISNCRAALSVGDEDSNDADDNVTISNCVIFGGAYCNIEIRNGTLNVTDRVITINQPHTDTTTVDSSTTKYVGLGVVYWIEAGTGTTLNHNNKLVQYNFVSTSVADSLPTITLKASKESIKVTVDASFNTSTIIKDLLTKTKIVYIATEERECLLCKTKHKVGDRIKENCCYKKSNTSYQPIPREKKEVSAYEDALFPDGTIKEDGSAYANTGIVTIDAKYVAADFVPVAIFKAAQISDSNLPKGYSTFSYTYTQSDAVTVDKLVRDIQAVFHLYLPNNTNSNLAKASQNAEYIYSPWEQTVNSTTKYGAYGFNSSGSILLSTEELTKLQTNLTATGGSAN